MVYAWSSLFTCFLKCELWKETVLSQNSRATSLNNNMSSGLSASWDICEMGIINTSLEVPSRALQAKAALHRQYVQ